MKMSQFIPEYHAKIQSFPYNEASSDHWLLELVK
jgi:hypothetical protein